MLEIEIYLFCYFAFHVFKIPIVKVLSHCPKETSGSLQAFQLTDEAKHHKLKLYACGFEQVLHMCLTVDMHIITICT